MKSFHATTTINADAGTVWALLTDAAAYPTWNTTVDRIDGDIDLGSKITVHAKINPGRTFPLKVTELDPRQRMTWVGGMPLGLFRGVRTFTLRPVDGGVEFSMREDYSGPMAALVTRSIPDLQPAFDEFAQALKHRAEQGANQAASDVT